MKMLFHRGTVPIVPLAMVLCVSFLYPGALPFQQRESGQTPVIRVSTNLISVPVSVTNSTGEPIKNLKAEDFRIEEDGKPQSIANVAEPGHTPVELALLFDISGSVLRNFEFAQQSATRFLENVMRPTDAVSFFAIGATPQRVQDRVVGTKAALAGLSRIEPTRQETAFFDSVVAAALYIRQTAPPDTRRVMVVLSDGEDNSSEKHNLSDTRRYLHESDCIFYSINPSGPSIRLNKISMKGQQVMQELATETGGAAFLPDTPEDLDAIFTRISAELKAQYLLGYYSTDQRMDGSFRRIVVRLPKMPELKVRARQGYYAVKHQSSPGQ